MIFLNGFGQNQNWAWAKCAGLYETFSHNSAYASSVSCDNSGNEYVVGAFYDTLIIFDTINLINNGWPNSFLVKYDANGNAIWARSVGGNNWDEATSIAVDATGNIYIAGYYLSQSVMFGSTNLTNSNQYSNVFLAKYDSSGNFKWVSYYSNPNYSENDIPTRIKADNTGNVYVTGTSSGSWNGP